MGIQTQHARTRITPIDLCGGHPPTSAVAAAPAADNTVAESETGRNTRRGRPCGSASPRPSALLAVHSKGVVAPLLSQLLPLLSLFAIVTGASGAGAWLSLPFPLLLAPSAAAAASSLLPRPPKPRAADNPDSILCRH